MNETFERIFETEGLSHEEKYRKIVEGLGFKEVSACVPFPKEKIVEALAKDENLNNLPLKEWDRAAGFRTNGSSVVCVGSPLLRLIAKAGVRTYSCAQCVCLLKACAKMIAEN